jgi:hypothetical protein
MNQPTYADIRFYSKISQSIENMEKDIEELSEYSNLYARLGELKSELEISYPDIHQHRIDVMLESENSDTNKEIMLALNEF